MLTAHLLFTRFPRSREADRLLSLAQWWLATAIWSTSGISHQNHGGGELFRRGEDFFHLLGRRSQITEQYGVTLRPVGDASWIHLETNGN
jgi:hypothetical protein